MRLGLHALGIGAGADPEVILAVAGAAEAAGLSTLWAGEHVVMVDGPNTRYPYSPDGRIAVRPEANWLDPWTTLTFAAPVTSRVTLATGVLLLPEHNPVVVAKRAASLDALSKGRLVLGVGIGWSAAEFGALGIPFAGRARRTREYVEAMRTLWRDDPAAYAGEFVSFDSVRSFPKPAAGRIPVVLGGNSDAALERVARYGDGWYGFNLAPDELPERLATLESLCRRHGRHRSDLDVAVSLSDGSPEVVPRLAELAVDELVLVTSPPAEPAAAAGWVAEVARPWHAAKAG